MPRYLDPKNDLTFKKIFGEHPDLLISFLNALMPLEEGQLIESVEYLPSELVPNNPAKKDSIVDVRCMDSRGRQFIVEMQMFWSEIFKNRMVFNASKAYVRQMGRGDSYELLQPVYGLGIINDIFDRETPEFYHHYQTVNRNNTSEVISGLEFVMVELPKFRPEKWKDKKMAVLWLRFLKETRDMTENISLDLLENESIRKALDICRESAFSMDELEIYDRYWDHVSTEKGIVDSAKKEGREEGRAEGRNEAVEDIVIQSSKAGLPLGTIQMITKLPQEKLTVILEKHGLQNYNHQ